MTKVLVIDDDPQLLRALAIDLKARRYEVWTASTGTDGLRAAADFHPDVIVLDLGLPDLDGTEVIARLRDWTRVPIVVLSARHGSTDKVVALDTGADDYITKPFGVDELLARLRAATRRVAADDQVPLVTTAAFTIDLAARRVTRDGADVRLTPTEWRIIEMLARNPGRLITQRELLNEVWGPSYTDETHYLRVYLGQLRRKLEPDAAHPQHLLTEPGRGYRLQP